MTAVTAVLRCKQHDTDALCDHTYSATAARIQKHAYIPRSGFLKPPVHVDTPTFGTPLLQGWCHHPINTHPCTTDSHDKRLRQEISTTNRVKTTNRVPQDWTEKKKRQKVLTVPILTVSTVVPSCPTVSRVPTTPPSRLRHATTTSNTSYPPTAL